MTVAGLASRGARIYMGARSAEKAEKVITDLKRELGNPHADIIFLKLDLTDFRSVVEAARELKSKETGLHGLINNAGIMGVPFSRTKDGYEIQFQTNYLSHWLFTYHLLPLLQSTALPQPGTARIVNVTSDGHERFTLKEGIRLDDPNLESESAMVRYGQSKLANILHTKQLNAVYGPKGKESGGIIVAAVHPGHIDTNLNKQATGMAPAAILRIVTPIMKCTGILDHEAKGALSSLFAIADPNFIESGAYIVPYAKIGKPSKMAENDLLAERLWEWTFKMFQEKGYL
ncbi:short-chain dehydrogenase [Talaromyces pinophilus]|uniref:Short-chain dehydrogenase n=1 Tax=Talaromyces pinophilus TaxID=128442 RepID=A0A6V8H1F2_TALPI|nr:short-chain dehydrogenase [Talaromyces pinophilus]